MSNIHDTDRLAVAANQNSKERAYWLQQLADPVSVFFPYDFGNETAGPEERGMRQLELDFSPEICSRLLELSNAADVKLNIVLTAAVTVLLYKYTGEKDILTAAPIYRQRAERPGLEFINTILPLRHRFFSHMSFQVLLQQVRQTIADAVKHQNFPILLLPSPGFLNLPGSCPLFDVAVLLQNIHDPQYIADAGINITFSFHRVEEKVTGVLSYNSLRFRRESVETLASRFTGLLETLIFTTDIELSRIDLLSEKERKEILEDFNGAVTDYPKNKTLHRLFEEQVKRTPGNVGAVLCGRPVPNTAAVSMIPGRQHLTYRELNKKSNQLARLLRANGVSAGTIVALAVEPSLEMFTGILGILKAGGAYMPVDPGYPADRINFMLTDSGGHILLTTSDLEEHLPVQTGIICLDDKGIYKGSGANRVSRGTRNNPGDPAYVIYTSGTGGSPRGVLVEHRNVTAYVYAFYNEFEVTPQDAVLQLAPGTFDIFTEEFYPMLLRGGRIVIPHPEEAGDIERLIELTVECGVTILDTTPLLLNEFNKSAHSFPACSRGRLTFISGGDVLKPPHVDRLVDLGRVYNTYGPTETTVCATYYRYRPDVGGQRIPIGSPIANYNVLILDEAGALQPVGVAGELCIGGPGVARGYINNPELTADKFYKSYKTYKTGDLCRWLRDGNIQFLGRKDQQVKIRGFRVELGEIESILVRHPAVKEAVALDLENGDSDKYLCAYIVFLTPHSLQSQDLKKCLARWLPDHMIPSCFVAIDHIPLTANRKIDRNALPEPEFSISAEYAAPRNPMEEKIVKIWQELFRLEPIGIDDDFFDLGGHSLNGIQLINSLQRRFHVKIPLVELFGKRTIRELGQYIADVLQRREKEEIVIRTPYGAPGYGNDPEFTAQRYIAGPLTPNVKTDYERIAPVEKREYYPQSSAQKRLFFLDRFEESGTGYNIPLFLKISGGIDRKRFRNAFRLLIRRHESLRTSFHLVNDEPVQRIHDAAAFKIEDCRGEPVCSPVSLIRPFDLSQVPLLRVSLTEIPGAGHLLFLDMHHIIADGVSMDILTNEFAVLYGGGELPPLKIQYRDFSQWQNYLFDSGKISGQQDYWLNVFSDAPDLPVLDLPTDFPRPGIFTFAGERYGFKLESPLAERFRKLSSANDATLFMNLLAAFYVLLYKYCGRTDIIVGTGSAGRRHADLHGVIGLFVNMLPLRSRPEPGKTYTAFLQEVKNVSICAFENQDLQFEALVEKLDLERDASRNPLFDVSFVTRNFRQSEKELEGITFEPYHSRKNGPETSKFDLSLYAYERGEKIDLSLRYYKPVFKRETVVQLARHLVNLVKQVTAEPGITIGTIDILSAAEKRKLLVEFNDTAVPYPVDKTIHRLFEEQVQRAGDKIAVIAGNHITYKLLNQRANQLADYLLKEKGVRPDDRVGIFLAPSIGRIVAVLGVLKAGGCYVPLDSALPDERLKTMIDDAGIGVVATRQQETRRLRRLQFDCPSFHSVLRLGMELFHRVYSLVEDPYSKENPLTRVGSFHPAYVIYTSGTTGKPRGVMVEHRSLVNLCCWHLDYYAVTGEDKAALYAGFAFDASVWEMFPYLVGGARLFFTDAEVKADVHELNRCFEKNRVTVCYLPTPFCEQFITMELKNRCLRILLTGGEKLHSFQPVPGASYRLYNNYGPTENTVVTTVYPVEEPGENIPIGKPAANNRIYILSRDTRQIQPVGVAGELCISGDGLARGYLNNPELTAEKFNKSYKSYRTYKTGDLCRWLADGNIEFLGRIDKQVKIRGYRIELGEVENRLLGHGKIKEAVVIARNFQDDGHGDEFLCAYIVPHRPGNFGKSVSMTEELTYYLSQSLPDYMIPSYFVKMAKIPLTVNGKVDRKALPCPRPSDAVRDFAAPRNQTEIKLAELWSVILGIAAAGIGIDDNFFRLGGHSLKTTVLLAKVRETFNVKVPPAEIFKIPTIRALARYVAERENKTVTVDTAIEDDQVVLLKEGSRRGPGGKNLFFIHAGTGEVEVYMGLVARLQTDFDCWGIRAERPGDYIPGNLTIEEIAAAYVKKIKRLQLHGPYHLTARCVGGVIAFEMVRRLEEMGETVGFFTVVDATPPKAALCRAALPDLLPHLKNLAGCIPDPGLREKTEAETRVEKVWGMVMDRLEKSKNEPLFIQKLAKARRKQVPPNFDEIIPDLEHQDAGKLFYYFTMMWMHAGARDCYRPGGKINTVLHYIGSRGVRRPGKENWNRFCREPVRFFQVEGDEALADLFNGFLIDY
ncbi:MAG: amino acid adenylation domain-containing protein [bacterium]|nr:amino acid adenylation domain-containing protein [bacterium]